jgi:hypothetical protein
MTTEPTTKRGGDEMTIQQAAHELNERVENEAARVETETKPYSVTDPRGIYVAVAVDATSAEQAAELGAQKMTDWTNARRRSTTCCTDT